MKRLATALFAAAALAASCTIMPEPVPVNVIFMGKAPVQVKGGWEEDGSIGSLKLLVYRKRDGMLLESGSCYGNCPLKASLPAGEEVLWYMLANAPEGMEESALGDFQGTSFSVQDGPVLHAEGCTVFLENTSVTACLARFACKVGLGSVSVNWEDALPCSLDTVALADVPVTTAAEALLYNHGAVTTDLGGLLAQFPRKTISSGAPLTLGTTLYCMPASDARLAICIRAWGQSNWYPIELPPMEGNHFYLVDNVVINGPGSAWPGQKPERTCVDFSVRVAPWEDKTVNAQFQL